MVKVTQDDINRLIRRSTIRTKTIFDKATLVTMQLENGFILTESSACVDPANYDQNVGYKICMEKIEDKLWLLEGYRLQQEEFQRQKDEKEAPKMETVHIAKPGDLVKVISNEYMSGVGLHEFKEGTILEVREVAKTKQGKTFYRTVRADGAYSVRNSVPHWDVIPHEDPKKFKLQPGDLAEVTGDTGKELIGAHIYNEGQQVRILEKLNVGEVVTGEKYYKVAANNADNKLYGWYVLEKDLKKVGGN